MLLCLLDHVRVILLVLFVTVFNLLYFVNSKRSSKRLNRWYEYSINEERTLLHFSPSILIGYWANRSTLLRSRKAAINKLTSLGYANIYGETISLTKINGDLSDLTMLEKWGKNGVLTLITTIFQTCFNLRNVFTLTVTRKIFNMICSHSFIRYRYR
ncbi:hypothetical protein D3C74_102330 [compost metagenome]